MNCQRLGLANSCCAAAVTAALALAFAARAEQVVRNYDTLDLRQWGAVHCGGPTETCPCPLGAKSCPAADTQSPLPTGGRFEIDQSNQIQGSGALKVTLCDGDRWNSNTCRNELVNERVFIDKGEKWFFWYTRFGDSSSACATQNSCSSTAECFPPPPARRGS